VVEVLVVVPAGANADALLNAALQDQGARRLNSSRFATLGFIWPTAGIENGPAIYQEYNPAGEPAAASGAFSSAWGTWNGLAGSSVDFQQGSNTTRCPSLVRECPGKQSYDGNNDVGWLSIKGCCTLGVTWFGVGPEGNEADMALNSGFTWVDDANDAGNDPDFDAQTVFLHELGHVLGLDHSSLLDAVMYATYQGGRRVLDQDDERGAVLLYPNTDNDVGTIGGIVSGPNGPIAGATVSVGTTPLSAITNASGVYSVDGVPDIGSYSLTVSASGFETINTGEIYQVPDGSADISMTPSSGDGDGECVPKGRFGFNCP
jgi:hypothetical protein